jgi:hypothetical protein
MQLCWYNLAETKLVSLSQRVLSFFTMFLISYVEGMSVYPLVYVII